MEEDYVVKCLYMEESDHVQQENVKRKLKYFVTRNVFLRKVHKDGYSNARYE